METNKVLFSVIVPVYNIEKYIDKCITSIMNQTFTNLEIILVDDGSSDKCPYICDEYEKKDPRIKVIHKENGGPCKGRQAGVKIATGEYIACVDGDDWIAPDYFEKFAAIIQQWNPDIVCSGAVWVYENKSVNVPIDAEYGFYDRKQIENKIFPILIENKFGTYFSPSLWAKVFKRNLFLSNQLAVDGSVKIGEDGACAKPCIYDSKSMFIMKDCNYYYRQNPYSITKSRKAFEWDAPEAIAKHFESQIPMNQFDFQEQVYRNLVHNLFNVAVSQFNRLEKYSTIKNNILIHLNNDYYQNAVQKCKYDKKAWKGRAALHAVKYKKIFIMYIYNRLSKWFT